MSIALKATPSICAAMVKLDRKLSRATFNREGTRFTAEDLDVLTSIGMIARVSEAKAKLLEEHALCRQTNVVPMQQGQDGVVKLDTLLTRASFNRRGVGVTAEDLDILTSLGVLGTLSETKSSLLKEQAACRQSKAVSISAAPSGSTIAEDQTAPRSASLGTYGGTTKVRGGMNAEARARMMFG